MSDSQVHQVWQSPILINPSIDTCDRIGTVR
jgi:hypothetical protein